MSKSEIVLFQFKSFIHRTEKLELLCERAFLLHFSYGEKRGKFQNPVKIADKVRSFTLSASTSAAQKCSDERELERTQNLLSSFSRSKTSNFLENCSMKSKYFITFLFKSQSVVGFECRYLKSPPEREKVRICLYV